jgi:hypothetical protein
MDGLGHMKKKDVVDSIPFLRVISSKTGRIGSVWMIDKGFIKCYKDPIHNAYGVTHIRKPAVFTVLDRGEEGWYAIHVVGESKVDWINVKIDRYALQEVKIINLA